MDLPKPLALLIDSFSKLPGIGEKSATRLALNIVQWNSNERREFSNALELMDGLRNCNFCNVLSDEPVCQICSNEKRKSEKTICVIENINDLIAIEKSEQYYGNYFVLGGVLNPLLGVGPKELYLDKLESMVQEFGTRNLILAINPSVEGDATCSYIKELLSGQDVDIQRIGFGIPMGGSLEYVDSMTISKAFENRKQF